MKKKRVLTIAGFDPSGWAGVLADMRTFEASGLDGVAAVTALTLQSRSKVAGFTAVPPSYLEAQVELLLEDMSIDAVKVGMIGCVSNARTIEKLFSRLRPGNVVLDPVLASSGGHPLIDRGGVAAIKRLLPLVKVVTPNIGEAEALTGIRVSGIEGMEEAAATLVEMGAGAAVVKGGHLGGSPTDVVYDGKRFHYLKGRRLAGRNERFHGTGCVFSSALASGLARGWSVKLAATVAKEFLSMTIKARKVF